MGAMGKAGNVLVPLCSPCKSGAHGKATFSAALQKALAHHKLYVNVHTAKNPNGEIRGQLAKMYRRSERRRTGASLYALGNDP